MGSCISKPDVPSIHPLTDEPGEKGPNWKEPNFIAVTPPEVSKPLHNYGSASGVETFNSLKPSQKQTLAQSAVSQKLNYSNSGSEKGNTLGLPLNNSRHRASLTSLRSAVHSVIGQNTAQITGGKGKSLSTVRGARASTISLTNRGGPNNRSSTSIRAPGAPVAPSASGVSAATPAKGNARFSITDMIDTLLPVTARQVTCLNCDDPFAPLAVWCPECFSTFSSEDENGALPPLFCVACNNELHKFAKSRRHLRTELAVKIRTLPCDKALDSSMPAVKKIVCSACKKSDVSIWCADCQSFLCGKCTKATHVFKRRKTHKRTAISKKYILLDDRKQVKLHVPKPPSLSLSDKKPTLVTQNSKKNVHVPSKTSSSPTNRSPSPNNNSPAIVNKDSLLRGKSFKDLNNDKSLSPKDSKPSFTPTDSMRDVNKAVTTPNPLQSSGSTVSKTIARKISDTTTDFDQRPDINIDGISDIPNLDSDDDDDGIENSSASQSARIEYKDNPGQAGDVICLVDMNTTNEIMEETLVFRNLTNSFDTIGNLKSIVSVSVGLSHAAAVSAAGTLFSWGDNTDCQLGFSTGDENECIIPRVVVFGQPKRDGDNSRIRQVMCGSRHTIALDMDGNVWTWGSGAMGVLGHPSDEDKILPTKIQLRSKLSANDREEVISVACGPNNSGCVVRGRPDNAQLYVWGEGNGGQIGNDKAGPQLTPVLVSIPTAASSSSPPQLSSMAFGLKHTLAKTVEGDVYSWGSNDFGQLGYSLPASANNLQLTPKRVDALLAMKLQAHCVCAGERHTTIVTKAGRVYSWGSGETHQLGILDNVDKFSPVPADIVGADGQPLVITNISIGSTISAAVASTGEVFMWGWGVESAVPVFMEGLKGHFIQYIGVGANENIVFHTGVSRELYEWSFEGGEQEDDEVAKSIQEESQSSVPTISLKEHGVPKVNLHMQGKQLVSSSVGKLHSATVTADGRLYAWGANSEFQLGLGPGKEGVYITKPMELKLKDIFKEVQCGVEHTLALTTEGRVYSWGTGTEGKLGHGSEYDIFEPKMIQSLTAINIRSISVGPGNSGAISQTGALYVWGGGNAGQIGNGESMPQLRPACITSLKNIKSIGFGALHVCALDENGGVYTWGNNQFGQLGIGSDEEMHAEPQTVRFPFASTIRVDSVQSGDNVCIAKCDDGRVWGWGSGEASQLPRADESSEDSAYPIVLHFPFQSSRVNDRVVKLSVRDINCSVITDKHQVWCWGWDFGPPKCLDLPTKDNNSKQAKYEWGDVMMGYKSLMLVTRE